MTGVEIVASAATVLLRESPMTDTEIAAPAASGQHATSFHEGMATALAAHPDVSARETAAASVDTAPEALERLAHDDVELVRIEVAFNSAASEETLSMLARDECWEVREGVAANAATPPEVQVALAFDDESLVRAAVAYNSATSEETLAKLAKDETPIVQRALELNQASGRARSSEDSVDVDAVFGPRMGEGRSLVGEEFSPSLPDLAQQTHQDHLCDRIVESTGKPCLLVSAHNGRCRSVLKSASRRGE